MDGWFFNLRLLMGGWDIEPYEFTLLLNKCEVVRVCFFLLSPPTKQCTRDIIMRAVTIWGQERSRGRVSGCATCERKREVAKGKKRHVFLSLHQNTHQLFYSKKTLFSLKSRIGLKNKLRVGTSIP